MPPLYVTGWRNHVTLSSHHVEIHRREESADSDHLVARVPFFQVNRLVLVDRPRVSMRTVEQALRAGIPVQLVSATGLPVGAFLPARDGDAGLRVRQYRQVGSDWALENARVLVQAKLHNCHRAVRRVKLQPDTPADLLSETLAALRHGVGKALATTDAETLRGIEGAASRAYFGLLRHAFPPEMPFAGRRRHPPDGPANALLSWGYSIVMSEVRAAVEAQGLDPCIGVLHAIDYNRPALALDLMEPFRATIADRLALRLVNLKMIGADGFEQTAEHGWRLLPETRRIFFTEYERGMQRPFTLAGETKATNCRERIRATALAFAQALRAETIMEPFRMD